MASSGAATIECPSFVKGASTLLHLSTVLHHRVSTVAVKRGMFSWLQSADTQLDATKSYTPKLQHLI